MKAGDEIRSGADAPIKAGNALPLRHIPVGSTVHNIELKVGKGGQLARSAGGSAQFAAREGMYASVRLKSGEIRKIHIDCRATIGEVGNDEHNLRVFGKAGAVRWLGVRPTVRGVVMNPVDHPHGGGEGKSGQGNPHPVSPWGLQTKGKKTRHNKRTDSMIVQRRKNKRIRKELEYRQCLVRSRKARSSICTSPRRCRRRVRRTIAGRSRPGRAAPWSFPTWSA